MNTICACRKVRRLRSARRWSVKRSCWTPQPVKLVAVGLGYELRYVAVAEAGTGGRWKVEGVYFVS